MTLGLPGYCAFFLCCFQSVWWHRQPGLVWRSVEYGTGMPCVLLSFSAAVLIHSPSLEQDEKSRVRPTQDYGFPSPSKVIIERYIVLCLFPKISHSKLTFPGKKVSPVFLPNPGKKKLHSLLLSNYRHVLRKSLRVNIPRQRIRNAINFI